MTTWEEIRDEVAGTLADGQPLEDVISKLDEMKNSKPMTNEEWFISLPTEEKAKWLSRNSKYMYGCGRMETTPKVMYEEDWEWWLKQPHREEKHE